MNKKERIRMISIIIFWGAMWGIAEATVGYLLHMMPFRVPTGSILFPIGYIFMQKSFKETNSLKSIVYTAGIAAFIKLINLFSPGIPVIRVLNPAFCILLEGLAVGLVIKLFKSQNEPIKYIQSLIMSLSWRIGYYIMCFAIFIPLSMMKASSIVAIDKFMEFFIINGLINSVMIYYYSKWSSKTKKEIKINYRPIYVGSLFFVAIIIQWII